MTDLRAAFGEGFLDESKLIVNDLIEASKSLKEHARGAGQDFGDEILMARTYLTAGFDTALVIAGQIKDTMAAGGIGQVILESLNLGANVLGKGIVMVFEVSLPLWKTIGTILGQGVLVALYGSNFPGAEMARGMAMRRTLRGMDETQLRKLSLEKNLGVDFVTRQPGSGGRDYSTKPFYRPRTRDELAADISDRMQKRMSIEEQIAFANVDPGQAIADSIEKSRAKITQSVKDFGSDMVAELQEFVDNLAAAGGQEPVDIQEVFNTSLKERFSEGGRIIEEWRKKLEVEGQAVNKNVTENAEAATDAVEASTSDRARALSQMYSTIQVYDKRAYEVKLSLLNQELEEFRKLKIAETDIVKYELERRRQLQLEHAEESDDLAKGFTTTWEDLEDQRLTLGKVGGESAKVMHGEWVGAFQGMATEGEKSTDAMEGFFKDVGDAFSDMMAQMAAEALLFEALAPAFTGAFGWVGGLFSGGGDGGGSKTGPAPYPVHHFGTTVDSGGPSRMVDPGVFAFARRYHSGLRPDEFPAILQQGEKVIPKGGSDGNANLTINLRNESGVPLEINQSDARRAFKNQVLDVVIRATEDFFIPLEQQLPTVYICSRFTRRDFLKGATREIRRWSLTHQCLVACHLFSVCDRR